MRMKDDHMKNGQLKVGYGGEENYQAVLEEHERTPLITYAMYHKEQKKNLNKTHSFPQTGRIRN